MTFFFWLGLRWTGETYNERATPATPRGYPYEQASRWHPSTGPGRYCAEAGSRGCYHWNCQTALGVHFWGVECDVRFVDVLEFGPCKWLEVRNRQQVKFRNGEERDTHNGCFPASQLNILNSITSLRCNTKLFLPYTLTSSAFSPMLSSVNELGIMGVL